MKCYSNVSNLYFTSFRTHNLRASGRGSGQRGRVEAGSEAVRVCGGGGGLGPPRPGLPDDGPQQDTQVSRSIT